MDYAELLISTVEWLHREAPPRVAAWLAQLRRQTQRRWRPRQYIRE